MGNCVGGELPPPHAHIISAVLYTVFAAQRRLPFSSIVIISGTQNDNINLEI